MNQIALFDHPDHELQAWAKAHTAKIRVENAEIMKLVRHDQDLEIIRRLAVNKLKAVLK